MTGSSGGRCLATAALLLVSLGAACGGQPSTPSAPATPAASTTANSTTSAEASGSAETAATARDESLPATTSPYDALPERVRSLIDRPAAGDFDEMVKRRLIRVGVTFNRTHYFIDRGQEHDEHEGGPLPGVADEHHESRRPGFRRP